MLWPLIEFGSLFFFILFGVVFALETSFLWNKQGSQAITSLIVLGVLSHELMGVFGDGI